MLEFPLVMFHGFSYYYCFTAVECFFCVSAPVQLNWFWPGLMILAHTMDGLL